MGEVKFRKGLIVGAELEKPVGHCNGSVNGETYFTCAENLGLFARERYVEVRYKYIFVIISTKFKFLPCVVCTQEFDAQKASVFKIQSRIRGVLGRIRAIKTLNSHVWNILDNNMEQVCNFLAELLFYLLLTSRRLSVANATKRRQNKITLRVRGGLINTFGSDFSKHS